MTHTEEQGELVHDSQLQWTEEIYYDKMLGGYLFEGVFHLFLDKFHEETESKIMECICREEIRP